MTRQSEQPVAATGRRRPRRPSAEPAIPTHHRTDGGEQEENPYDLSMDHIPADWVEAQIDSPLGVGDSKPLPRSSRVASIPTGHESPFIPNIAALGASFVGGTAWYLIEVLGYYRGPWITVLLGALIAVAVRSTGIGERTFRALLCVSAYLLTVLLVLAFLTHRDLTAVYGSSYDFNDYEAALVRTRFKDTWRVAAYLVGLFVAGQIGYFRRSGR